EADFYSTWSGHQNQAEAIAISAGYQYRVEQRNLDFRFIYGSWQFGNAILSKFPLSGVNPINYPPEKHWEDWLVGCKRGVVCEVTLNEITSVRVAAIHLEHRSESVRLASAKLLGDLAKQSGPPLILAGDFNSTPSDFPNSTKTNDGDNTLDWIIESGLFEIRPDSNPTDEQYTFSSYSPRSVIDWIMIPAGGKPTLSFVDYRSIDTDLSDHRPVIADIEINAGLQK
ncbi:MAG: endonuclease/exonuclease/phosphatase family protein, partial [Mariniblastus sp.]